MEAYSIVAVTLRLIMASRQCHNKLQVYKNIFHFTTLLPINNVCLSMQHLSMKLIRGDGKVNQR